MNSTHIDSTVHQIEANIYLNTKKALIAQEKTVFNLNCFRCRMVIPATQMSGVRSRLRKKYLYVIHFIVIYLYIHFSREFGGNLSSSMYVSAASLVFSLVRAMSECILF